MAGSNPGPALHVTELLLRLLNVPLQDAGRIAGASLSLRGGLSLGWFLVSALALVGLSAWLYRRSPGSVSRGRRFLLTALRAVFLVLLLALLLRPVLSFTVEGSIRRVLVLLMDASASMQIKDPRIDAPDQKRVAIARDWMDPKGGLGQTLDRSRAREVEQVARVELLKAVLRNERMALLPRLDQEFDLAAFSFGRGVAELSARATVTTTNNADAAAGASAPKRFDWVDSLEASSPTTAIGDALREVINRKRGQPVAGIVLITDGVSNVGSQPQEAAALAAQEQVPLFIYGVGITSPRDIIVQNLFAPEVSFVREEVTVTVRVRGQGMAGQAAEVQLRLGEEVVATPTLFSPHSSSHFLRRGDSVSKRRCSDSRRKDCTTQWSHRCSNGEPPSEPSLHFLD